jgi:hypothetical protein
MFFLSDLVWNTGLSTLSKYGVKGEKASRLKVFGEVWR